MKRILVTGGAGFIGSHLCKRLLEEGNHIVCLDDFSTCEENNISGFLENENFELIKGDVADPIDMQVDEIYNLACPASPVHYQKTPVKTIKTNIIGALNTLELAHKNKAKILQASTSEIYGDPEVHPQVETYRGSVNPIGPRACYDEGKRCAETLFFDFKREYDLEIKVARIFNTYGPNMYVNDGRVVSNFIIQALEGNDITIYGDGNQTRSFCYVEDNIDGLIKLMNTDKDFTGPVNIGNPVEVTMTQLAKKIIELTNSSSKLVYKPLPEDDPRKRRPDITLAKKALDWEPKVSLDDGLIETIKYFKEIQSNKVK